MKKFAPLFIATAALASLQGCATEAITTAEMTAEDQAAVCANPEGTNAAIAALATAITLELHRWQIAPLKANGSVPAVAGDFYKYRGYNNQEMLGLTSAGLAACGSAGCPLTKNMLAVQDSRMDQKIIINGTRVSSWSFASRLVTGFDKQVACNDGKWCPYVPHVFGWKSDGTYDGFTSVPASCDTLFTFNANKPNHAVLTAAETKQLENALVWTAANGPNPYIAYQSTASTVSIDPGGNMVPPYSASGAEQCQKVSMANITGQFCTCATSGVTNGGMKNDDPIVPKTYFCRQVPLPPPPPATGGTSGMGGSGGSSGAPAAGTGGSQ
jgi:hypothetical protein